MYNSGISNPSSSTPYQLDIYGNSYPNYAESNSPFYGYPSYSIFRQAEMQNQNFASRNPNTQAPNPATFLYKMNSAPGSSPLVKISNKNCGYHIKSDPITYDKSRKPPQSNAISLGYDQKFVP